MNTFFHTLPEGFVAAFRGKHAWYHVAAVVLTIIIVVSGFDWQFYLATRGRLVQALSFPGVIIGGLVPIVLPLSMLAIGFLRRDTLLRLKAWMLGQAALLGLIISSAYKAVTGRIEPGFGSGTFDPTVDLSRQFNFGFFEHGVFWGWPSSHTTTAFAVAVAFLTMFPKSRARWFVLAYALYVGLGISTTIHWFSEFVAGALIGTAVGYAVGKTYETLSRHHQR